MYEPCKSGWRVTQASVVALLAAAVIMGLPTSAKGVTVLSKSHNTDIRLGVPYGGLEYENPLSGTEMVAGYSILEWRDAEIAAGHTGGVFDDWQGSGSGITGTLDEAWLTMAGQVLQTETTVPSRIVSIHLAGDPVGHRALVKVDGVPVAELDMASPVAQATVLIVVGELPETVHMLEVLDLGPRPAAPQGEPARVRILGGAVLEAKWYQPPEPAHPDNLYYGWNEVSVVGGPQLVADDWFCDSKQPVSGIRWWGSFLRWREAGAPAQLPDDFLFTFWTDVAAGVDTEFSHPGRVVWEAKCENAEWRFAGWDYDPRVGTYEAAFEFKCALPVEDWFFQKPRENQVYWLSIAAHYADGAVPEHVWGWKARPRDPNSPAPDDAVRIFEPLQPTRGTVYARGEPIYWPTREESWDMAFELLYTPLKWGQPPVLRDDDPCYYGWDEFSVYGANQIVADDWYCSGARPVTSIYWWGSYLDWQEPTPPPEVPTGFHIGVWHDTPAGVDAPFSHPRDMIHEWRVPRDQVAATWVGCDFHPDHGQESAFLYRFDIPEELWFYQGPEPGIYWISIAAVYGPADCPCDGDVNRDGDLAGEDLTIVQQNIGCPVGAAPAGGPPPFCNESDVNCDGVVDAADVEVVECQLRVGWTDPNCCGGVIPPHAWGWKTRPHNLDSAAPDDAVRVLDPTAPGIDAAYGAGEPITDNAGNSWDAAFILVTTEEPPFIKWSQPPAPYNPPDGYFGWDEVSIYAGPQIVADDWYCDDSASVTDIHWWGSFVGWGERQAPPVQPINFHIAIWTDEPVGAGEFSHPREVVWEPTCEEIRKEFVGWDFFPGSSAVAPEATFRYSCKLSEGMEFRQEPGGNIYWVSISAVYEGAPPHDYPWGWKTRPHRNDSLAPDDAVVLFEPTRPDLGMTYVAGAPIYYPTPADSWDTAFVLTSGPPPVGACCYPDEAEYPCRETTQLVCERGGGVYYGDDTACGRRGACCLPDGSCRETAEICCEGEGGWMPGSPVCLGDGNNNGVDDACDGPMQACCLPDAAATCDDTTHMDCVLRGGDPQGPGTSCNVASCELLKWSQPPVLNPASPEPECYWGWDELSNYRCCQIAADDFACLDDRAITDIHWWGSYQGWMESDPPASGPDAFHIGIWTDVPVGVDADFSHPKEMIWEWTVPRDALNERPVGCDFFGPEVTPRPDTCFRYEFFIPQDDWFFQGDSADTRIYWVSISAVYINTDPDAFPWGWKTRPRNPESQAPDAAVVITLPNAPGLGAEYAEGRPILVGPDRVPWDLAFVLTTKDLPVGACCFPNDPNYPCIETTRIQCNRAGGVYYGDGTACGVRGACCMRDGSCRETAEICCEREGGWMPGGPVCLGDNNHNGVDDACDGPMQACCLPDAAATCDDTTHMDCVLRGGDPQGPGTECFVTSCRLLKWSQPPLLNPASPEPECFWGWDEDSHYQCCQIMADDFVCADARPITDIHWWGSYRNWTEREAPASAADRFHIGIWTDVPAPSPDGISPAFSHPGMMVWDWVVPREALNERPVGCDFINPDVTPRADTCFRYDFYIPEEGWFYQGRTGGPRIYWVSISAIYLGVEPPADYPWGWKTRPRDPESPAPDAAVKIFDPRAPVIGDTFVDGAALITGAVAPVLWDMTFILTTREVSPPLEACCLENQGCQDLNPNGCIREGGVPQGPGTSCQTTDCTAFKWMQLPTTVAGTPDACFWGWDEPSHYECCQIVADDWMCQDGRPVTDVHWWGSYVDWQETFPPRGAPEQFRIGIWTNAPDPGTEFSHPEELIWEWIVPRQMLNERPVGCDYHPDFGEPETCFQYDFIIPEDRWFRQESECAIYWISIAAEYTSGPPVVPWGWKTRPHVFEDDAVRILEPLAPQVGDRFLQGRPIEHPQGVSWDMAFALTSTKVVVYPKWSQPLHNQFRNFAAASDIWLPQQETPPTIKWEQLPNEEYPGVKAYDWYDGTAVRRIVAANDWECEGGLVSDFHWWGTVADRGEGIRGFHLSIHESTGVPPAPSGSACLPGALLWERNVPIAEIVVTPTGVLNSVGLEIMRYDYDLPPDEWMPQEQGRTYWLDVSASSIDPRAPYVWLWQESGRLTVPVLCPAATLEDPPGTDWRHIFWPESGTFSELAFVVTSRDFPPEVNKVVADDFISDGRPVTDVRWWGSYLDRRYHPDLGDAVHVLDGWLLTFHWADVNERPGCPPDLMLDRPPTALGVYFAPADAVEIGGLFTANCLGQGLYQYTVDLDWCCLLCSEVDPRSDIPESPAQQGAFFEVEGLRYWLSIQAVVGTEWVPPACDMVRTGHLPSDLVGNAGHFWGWQSTDQGGLAEACTGWIMDFSPYPPNCWDYGMWQKQPYRCPDGDIPPPVHMTFELLTDSPDVAGPQIVHMAGYPWQTRPCTGYIDPRLESTDGVNLNLGVDQVTVVFNEPVFAPGGGPVGPADFPLTETGAAAIPNSVIGVTPVNPITYDLTLNRIITLEEWTTIQAIVEDGAGNPIVNLGDLGPGFAEPDRIDLAFLPCGINQDGLVSPVDLIKLRQFLTAGSYHNACADDLYFDIDRDGLMPEPQDLIRFRQMISGSAPATRVWTLQDLNNPQP